MGFSRNGVVLALYSLCLVHMTAAASLIRSEHATIHKRSSMTCASILSTRGDNCETLSRRCGISQDNLLAFNPNSTCSSLPLGKPVCCSDGAHQLPPKGNGAMCYVYTVEHGDTCAKIADGFGVTVPEIVKWNQNTTAWFGCDHLEDGGRICVSAGEPPMPVALPDAVCGPRVPGTARSVRWDTIPSLNPCPAGQCCSIWGKCGTGPDFCGSSVPGPSASDPSAAGNTVPNTISKVTNGMTAIIPKASTSESKAATTATSKVATTKEVNGITTVPKAITTPPVKSSPTAVIVTPGPQQKSLSFDFLRPFSLLISVATRIHDAGEVPITTFDATKSVSTAEAAGELPITTFDATKTVSATQAAGELPITTFDATKSASTAKATSSVPTTLIKATKTTDNPPSTDAAGVVTVPSGWSLTLYAGWDCSGNYMALQGHNKKLEDSDCLVYGKNTTIGTVINDTSVSCRWWVEGGNSWLPCSETWMIKPNSWVMSNGLCTVTPNEQCDNYHDLAQTYGWRGMGNCYNRQEQDPTFGSMNCYVG